MEINSNRIAYKAIWVSIILNLFLFSIKLWAGEVSDSIALIADAWHTLTDSVSSIIALIGIYIASIPADKKHPYGHGRAELIASIIIGVLLFIIAGNFLIEGINRLRNHKEIEYGTIAIVVTIVSILTKEIMAQYSFWAARKTNSNSLKADAWHHRSDAVSSIVILIGIFLGSYFWWIDGVFGIIVAGLIAYAAYEIIKNGISPLLGEALDENLIAKIKQIVAKNINYNTKLHHFHLHDYGKHKELTFHIYLPKSITLDESYGVTSQLSQAIKNELKNFCVTIYAEPYKTIKNVKILLLCTGNSCQSQMAEGFLRSFDTDLEVYSAGSFPDTRIHSKAIKVMREEGIEIKYQEIQHVGVFLMHDFDYIITVCDDIRKNCPPFKGKIGQKLHISIEDPCRKKGTDNEITETFRNVRNQIKEKFLQFYTQNLVEK